MKTCCCSSHCKKYFDCQLADINNEGTNIVENYHEWGSGTFTDEGCVIEDYCGELGDYKMFEPIKKKTDYHQWKEWLDKWNIDYEEMAWNPNSKELIVGGSYCQASIVFDLEDNFKCMTAYE